MTKISGIYKIQSRCKPERIYIGSAKNIRRRKNEHKSDLFTHTHSNSKLQRHFDRYGWDDLVFSIIISCDECDLLTHEQFYIDTLNPWFNLSKTADRRSGLPPWNKGRKLTEEHKRHIAERQMGENNSMYGRPSPRKGKKGFPSPFKGKKGRYSEETLEKMRISNQRAWDRRKAERAQKIEEK
jgi:group I intron endonuclease